MAYPWGNGPFFNDVSDRQEDPDCDENNNNNDGYESDDKGKVGRKQPRKSTKGRKLKRWDGELMPFQEGPKLTTFAADEDQKLLLYIDYVCTMQGIFLPWDDIAKTMEPRNPTIGEQPMTGEAIKQHLSKLREHRDKERDDAPPKLDRNARRMAAAGKNALQTPLPTPRKSSGAGGQFGKGKVEIEGPVKKESTLLAPMSKSKQKRAEQAKKILGLGDSLTASGRVASAAGNVGKGVTGKRSRRPAIVDEEEYRGNTGTAGAVSTKQLRHPKSKDYSGLTLDFGDNIKNEPDSEDDLPLSKRRNVSRKSGISKQPRLGLVADTLQLWKNSDAKSADGETPVQSAGIERPTKQVIVVPSNNGPDQQNKLDLCQVPNTAPFGMPNGAGFSFNPCYPKNDHPGPRTYDQADQQGNMGDNLGRFWPQLQSGHPSPMDTSFMGPPTGVFPGPDRVTNTPYTGDAMDAVPPCTPSTRGHMMEQAVGTSVGAVTPYTPSTHGHITNQAVGISPFNSSPTYGSFSSHTLPGTTYDPNLGADISHTVSRTSSWNSTSANVPGSQDPFVTTNGDGAFGGLPAGMPNMNPSILEGASNMTATLADLDIDHYHSDNSSSQNLPDLAAPCMPAAGLGISIPQAEGGFFDPAAMIPADHALPQNELPSSLLTQPPTPLMPSGFDVVGSQDAFDDFMQEMSGHANLLQFPDNDILG